MRCLLDILNNATFAGIITVSLGAWAAKGIYTAQKNIDRKYNAEDELCKKLILLQEHYEGVHSSLNMISNTWIDIVSKQGPEEQKEFIKSTVADELKRGHEFLMYKIPENKSSITTLAEMYFYKDVGVLQQKEVIFINLKKWHDQILKYMSDGNRFPRKRTHEVPELSLIDIKNSIQELYKSFKR